MNDETDWLYEWKKMMCGDTVEMGSCCLDKHGTIINECRNCTGCPYRNGVSTDE